MKVFTQPSIKLSLILIYTLLLSKIAVAESSTSKLPPSPQLKISLLGVQSSPHLTLSSQQQALEQLEETRLKWRTLGNQSQEALTLLQLGILYQKIGSKTLALERYNEALSLYKRLKNPSQEALTLSKIGSVYLEYLEQLKVEQRFAFNHNFSVNSQYLNLRLEQTKSHQENVKRLYDQSLKIYQEINHLSGEASILIAMAQSPYLHHRPEQQKLLEKSLAIYQEIGDQQGEALVLGHLSELNLIEYGNSQTGWDLFNQAMTIYQEIYESLDYDHFTTRQAEANLLNIAAQYWWSNNQEKAFEFRNKSLELYREIGDKQGEALALTNIGDDYSGLEDRQKQLEFYTQALRIYQEIGDGVRKAKILDRLGLTYALLGEREKALESYQQELETLREVSQFYSKLGDSETALIFEYRQPIVLFSIGQLYAQLQDETNEVEAYNLARQIYQKWEDDEGETDFLIKIAEQYGKQDNPEKVRFFLNHAVTVYRETGNFQAEANLLREKIAGVYFYSLKDSEQGFEVLNKALNIYQKMGDIPEVAKTLDKIADLHLKLENREKALEFYNQVVRVYQELNDLIQEVYTLRIIGKTYYELGNPEKALEAFNQAVKVFQEQGNREKSIENLLAIGEDYIKLEDKTTAIIFYQQAIPITQQLGDYKKEAFILRKIGQLYYELESIHQAVETFQDARKVYQKNSDRSGEAWTLYEIGKSYTILGDFPKAVDSYNQALEIYEQEPDAFFQEERILDIVIRMGRIYAYLGEEKTALEYCNQSLTKAQNFPQSKIVRRSEMFREIGKLCYQIGDPEKALESFHQYWSIYQKLGLDREVVSLMRMGQDYTELGDSKQALVFFNRARRVYQDSGFSEGEIDTLSWMGQIYSLGGNDQQALENFQQALKIAQRSNNRSKEASILTEIAGSYSQLGDEEQALKFYHQALKIYQELGNFRQQIDILNKIGEVYHQLEDLEKALSFYNQALKISQEKDLTDQVFISRNIAQIYVGLGDLEKALKFLKQALNLNKKPSSSLYTDLGKVYSDLGELEQALEFFNKSLSLLNHQYIEAQAENLFGIAIVQRKQGNLDTALTQINTAILFIEETRTRKKSSEERLTFFASKQDYYEFYIDLLMELHEQHPSKGYNAEALNISERSKARNLLELLTEANTDIRKGVDPELVIQERNLQQQLDAVEQRRVELYNHDQSTQEQTTAIEQERQYLLQNYKKIQTQIREKSPSYAAITQPKPLTLKQIQQQILDDETLLLQYTLGEKRSFLWAVTKNSINSYELPPKAFIEEAVRAFFRSSIIFNRRHSSINSLSASKSLSQIILAPVASQLNHQRLAIVSDGILHYLPFAALSLPTSLEKNDIPLVVHHEIVNLPSASTLSILRRDFQHRKPAPKTLAIIADPVFSSQDTRLEMPTVTHRESWEHYNLNRSTRQLDIGIWDRLPGTRTEAEAILALVPPSESTFAFDFAANRDTVTNIQLNQYKIIHFATHGLFNSVNPELSGIVLSMVDKQGNSVNGFLRLHDIFNLDFSADLVVLSACKTGLGKQVRGEGLVGLTQGFMYAGTPRVLVSLWDVDDAATAEIMTRFYRLMFTEKLSAPEALRKAQLEMQTDTEWKSPYYWAAFILQGEWR